MQSDVSTQNTLVTLIVELKIQVDDLKQKLDSRQEIDNNFKKQISDLHRLFFNEPVKKDKIDLKAKFRDKLYSPPKKIRTNRISAIPLR